MEIKYSRTIGLVWIAIALYNLAFGFYYLYQYSTPFVTWLYATPIWITFAKIIVGAGGVINGTYIFKKNEVHFTFPISIVLLLYITIDLVRLRTDFFFDSGSNLLFLFIAILTLKLNGELNRATLSQLRERRTMLLIIIGLSPYLLDDWLSYDWFSFLH